MMIGSRVIHVTLRTSAIQLANKFHTTSCTQINHKWRQKKGLTVNPTEFGPLTNLPDYSYKDGRATPYGVNQFSRLQRHQRYAEKITQLVGEIDYAVERHERIKKQEEEERQKILASKLKPKGNIILESTNIPAKKKM